MEVRTTDSCSKVSRVRVPVGAAGGEFSSLWSTFCADFYFGVCSIPCVTAVARKSYLVDFHILSTARGHQSL